MIRKLSICCSAIAAALLLFTGCNSAGVMGQLSDVASYIEERPDSALAVIRTIPVPSSSRARAKHALLHSMALDKCYIDLKNDSILGPAIKYYTKFGNPDDRLKMYYYKGRIQENARNDEGALECFVKGERFAGKCFDYSAVGRLYTSKSKMYYLSYHFQDALVNDSLALDNYLKAGDFKRQIVSKLDMATSLICLLDEERAMSILCSLKQDIPNMDPKQVARFCEYYLTVAVAKKEDVYNALQVVYSNIPSKHNYPFLVMAQAYNIIGRSDSSQFYLNKYREIEYPSVSDNAYYMAMSDAMALQDDYQAAFENERAFISYEMNDLYERMQSEINFVEERSTEEYNFRISRIKSIAWIAVLSLLSVVLVIISYIILRRLKVSRDESQKLQSLCDTLASEKDALEKLSAGNSALSARMQELLKERIYKIEQVLLMRRSHGKIGKEMAILRLDELVNNQRTFLVTLSLLYSVYHPQFLSYLREKQLTETEIGYCCLYMMGLETKEVAELLETKSAYNTNASIRRKLGLMDSNLTLPDYLKQLEL